MTRLRRSALRQPGDPSLNERVRRGAVSAAVLRGAIAALTLALMALAVLVAPRAAFRGAAQGWHARQPGTPHPAAVHPGPCSRLS